MPETVDVVCPNPACPDREVEGDVVTRAEWTATYWPATRSEPGYYGPDVTHGCGEDGVPADDEKLIEEAEGALGVRCPECGVVTREPDGGCPHCAEALEGDLNIGMIDKHAI